MVGDNQGTVYTSNEGYGTAAIVSHPNQDVIYRGNVAEKRAERAEAAATEKANLEKLNLTPDWWFKHNEEITKDWNEAKEMYAQKRAAGIKNPFTEDREFAQKYDALRNKVEASKRLKTDYGALLNDINSAGAGALDTESVNAALAYYEQPLDQVYKSGQLQPPVKKKPPIASKLETLGKAMNLYSTTTNNKDWTDEDIKKFQAVVLTDEKLWPELQQMYVDQFDALPTDVQDTFNVAYAGNKGAMVVDMFTNDVNNLKPTKPITLDDVVDRVDKMTGDYVSKLETGATTISSKNPKSKALPAAIKSAEAILSTDQNLLNWVVKTYNIGDGKEITKKEAIKQGAKILGEATFNSMNKGYGKSLDEGRGGSGGGGGFSQEDELLFNNWYQKLVSGDRNAASMLAQRSFRGGVIREIAVSQEDGRTDWGIQLPTPGLENYYKQNKPLKPKTVRVYYLPNDSAEEPAQMRYEDIDITNTMGRGVFEELWKGVGKKTGASEFLTPSGNTNFLEDL